MTNIATQMVGDGGVGYLLQKIDTLITREYSLVASIDQGVEKLKRVLEHLNAILEDADASGEHDNRVRAWIQHIRELAYDVEDELYIISLGKTPRTLVRPLQERSCIGRRIEKMISKLKELKELRDMYPYRITISPQSLSSRRGKNFRMPPLYVADADVVGFEEPLDKLTSWARKDQWIESKQNQVMFVVGMGGSGKTTLVRKVYERVKEQFQCHAWIIVSECKDKMELIGTTSHRLCNIDPVAEESPTLSRSCFRSSSINADLRDIIRNYLHNKRYLLVLDDLWIKDDWDFLRSALPRDNGSRIFITTRRSDIAYSFRYDSTDVHNLQSLPVGKAKELFYKKAFREEGGTCPSVERLVFWSGHIIAKCQGLPLGIVEIAQLLYTAETEAEWKKLHDSLESELKSNGRLSRIMSTLCTSYNDLPYHLKQCFLYLSNFPETYAFKTRRLIRLWIAEGLIREETGKSLEGIGEDYLKELIHRNLMQVELDFDGRPKSCRIHNLIHKIIVSKSRDENFCTVRRRLEMISPDDQKSRRLSIQASNMPNKNFEFPCARTLFVFGSRLTQFISPSSFKLLRTLHLEGAPLNAFPSEITELLLLRYLCLSNTKIQSIPRSVGNLKNLETLDLKQTLVTKLPNQIKKLTKLRHLLVYRHDFTNDAMCSDTVEGFKLSSSWVIQKLVNLQKLSFIKVHKKCKIIGWLGNLTQLRKLGITDVDTEDGPALCKAIHMLPNLHSLDVVSSDTAKCLDLQEMISFPPPLQRLNLKGNLTRLPDWISKLADLTRIRLKRSWLSTSSNPIGILQNLPNLLELQLLDAYNGNQLDFNAGKFQTLKILRLEQLQHLRVVRMEDTTLPCLQKLFISQCDVLEQIPSGIVKLTHLQELNLFNMPADFVAKLKRNGGELSTFVSHVPKINSYNFDEPSGYWATEDLHASTN